MRVGRSVWELKIDPKRFREEIKNDIEKRRKKRDEKKSIKSDKKSFKKLWHRLTRQRGEAGEKEAEQFGRPRPLGSPHARGLINN